MWRRSSGSQSDREMPSRSSAPDSSRFAMCFDTTELGDVWTEICAYGTAVLAVPVSEGAHYTASQLGYGGAPQQPAAPAATAATLWCGLNGRFG